MRNLLLSTTFGAMMIATGGTAATLNFANEANVNGERGEISGYFLNNANTGNMKVTFTSSHSAYFDGKSSGRDAGLGVCKVLTKSKQCGDPSDDNVTAGEWVTIAFEKAQTLSKLLFRDANHFSLISATKTLLFAINGGTLKSYTFADLSTAIFNDVKSATFQFGGGDPAKGLFEDQFYIEGATVVPFDGQTGEVPLPASLPLLLAGIGALAAGAKRRARSAA